MRLTELVRQSAGMRMVDEDGEEDILRLLPPATARDIATLEAAIPCPIPAQVGELLGLTRGFENGPLESLDFAGVPGGFAFEEIFPNALALAHDGFGNYWVADLHSDSTDWAPIYYVCHDPPVVAFQSDNLDHFVREVLRFANPPHESEVDVVHERVTSDIWRRNPGTITPSSARSSDDPVLRRFAEGLDTPHLIIDLRDAQVGDGFSWGRYGPRTRIVRSGHEPVFAYRTRSRWQRLLGG